MSGSFPPRGCPQNIKAVGGGLKALGTGVGSVAGTMGSGVSGMAGMMGVGGGGAKTMGEKLNPFGGFGKK